MAAINSLTYLLYSVLTLAANNKPTTDYPLNGNCGANEEYLKCGSACPSTCENLGKLVPCTMQCVEGCFCPKELVRNDQGKCVLPEECTKTWEIGSESQVTEKWNHDPHYVTSKYNEESCPTGETWSDCDAGCEQTCENSGKPVICPRMCVPGCVCEEPGTVRGPNKKCIHPPLCPSADVDPDETTWAEQDPNIPRVDPDETDWAEQDPNIPRVDPDESVWAEQDPDIPGGKLNSGGCPSSSACSRSCKRQGYKWGLCTGPDKTTCHCYLHMSAK